ncbi:DUF3048 domain-containing protein [Hazenella coriacea]|uniref:DUF3048 family protein n=1 Tax=Hazenella coriacea TaxID=1179467 RepID=A0A4V2UVI2_9BACL|nr:DUF3048 domain-containing protein [Hazenella coriacea]TCS95897.1 DUF3048 family protein [Hazenella coriacea]
MKPWIKSLLFTFLLIFPTACSIPSLLTKENDPTIEQTEPLTGLTTSQKNMNHPAFMIMINNHRQARPQTGLYLADIVVEMLAEGEITRFAAFYHSASEGTIGPVRSVRNYYLDLAEGTQSITVHAGGARDALKRIQRESLPSLDGIHKESQYFTRVDFRKAPHNLYTQLERLNQVIEKHGYSHLTPSKSYSFHPTGSGQTGVPAHRIDLVYHPLYKVGYQYDNASQSYIRYTEGERQKDRETEQPLMMQNVLVVFAEHQIVDGAGHRSIDVRSGGEGFLFQKGESIPIEWKYRDGWMIPYVEGKEISLISGKTWINVLPETGKVSFH